MNIRVLFNIPNIIGYIRLILLIIGSYKSKTIFLLCYCVSSALDFFDGFFARRLNQSTVLGKCLDMFTDRISTVVISMRCIKEKSSLYLFLNLYIIVDILSHMLHFYLSALEKTNHKNNNNFLLSIYYYKPFLFTICLLTEYFFIYILTGIKKNVFYNFLYYCTVVKMGFHIVQLLEAICKLSDYKEKTV